MSDALAQLEERVSRAARRLRELGIERKRLEQENTELRARLRGLEAQSPARPDREVDRLTRERREAIAVLEAVARELRSGEAHP
jgi:septal ring factor EnvC (AmiA/AmiB activator)